MNRTVRGLQVLTAAAVVGLMAQAASAQTNCLANTQPTGNGVREFEPGRCGGLTVQLSIPESCTEASRCGFITELNGVTLDAKITNRNTMLDELGREKGFVVMRVTGPRVLGLPALRGGDDQRIIQFIEEGVRKLNVNRDRVHLSGFSQGAGAALRIACNRPDLIASLSVIAPAGGLTPNCLRNGLPVAGMLFAQSSRDQLVQPARTAGTVRSIVTAMGLQMSAGQEIARADRGARIVRFQNNQGVLESFTHDADGATVGAGHCFFGSFEGPQRLANANVGSLAGLALSGNTNQIVDLQFGCNDADQIRIGPKTIEFFEQNTRRAGGQARPQPQ